MAPSAPPSEEQLIATMTARVPHPPSPEGPGDDAALLAPVRPGEQRVCTTDLMVEGVHFLRGHPPAWLGHKLLAVNLSDVAAMGAVPEAFVVSAALPRTTPAAWWDALADGVGALARAAGVQLVGGDVVRSPGPIMLGVTAWGRLSGAPLTRSGGRPGDVLMVRAADGLGRSRAGLTRWLATPAATGEFGAAAPAAWQEDACLRAHLCPDPDLRAGAWALAHGATAGLDLSDGLAVDAPRLATASSLRLAVDLSALTLDGDDGGLAATERAAGGEDYALLVLVPPGQQAAFEGRGFCAIGHAEQGRGVGWFSGGREVALEAAPFRHFPVATGGGGKP